MIISKTPYRVPLSGGGTDVNFYYSKYGSHFVSTAISEYVYVFLTERKLDKNFMIQTSSVEFATNISSINHNLIRETVRYFKIKEKLQISTISTVPTSTGLGTSSAMLVGLIRCISEFKKINLSKKRIVEIAYEIERNICKYEGGWQDQIVSTFGGFLDVKISKDEKIKIRKLSHKKIKKIVNNHFILVYSQVKRDSSKIIKSQKKNLDKTINYYNKIKQFNIPLLKSINHSDPKKIGSIFNEHWQLKKSLNSKISGSNIEKIYNKVKKVNTFLGAKLIGAGGGGFFLVSVGNKKKAISSIKKIRLDHCDLKFESNGSNLISI